ncbi:MAG TPA: DUF1343 domain-containing protein [Anaerolineae bacterium]
MVKPGISILLERYSELLAGKRLGLVTNTSAILPDLNSSVDALRRLNDARLVALFAPEHGIDVAAGEGVHVLSNVDRATGLPVHSLYGEARRPSASMLEGLDVLVFDIQSVGARFYTYITTLRYVLEAAAAHHLPVIVCDRPNPIGGEIVEGPVLEPEFVSFVGPGPLPIRYALTTGELARLYVNLWGIHASVEVIPCAGWRRRMWFDQTGLIWAAPSPNLPSLESAILYPGMCLLEGTNLSEGRGTALPFQMAGAPWLDGQALADSMNRLGLPGIGFRPVQFEPACAKWAGERCSGVQLHILDRDRLRPVTAVLHLLAAVNALHPQAITFHASHFDRLVGTDSVRHALNSGVPVDEIASDWLPAQTTFVRQRAEILMYN